MAKVIDLSKTRANMEIASDVLDSLIALDKSGKEVYVIDLFDAYSVEVKDRIAALGRRRGWKELPMLTSMILISWIDDRKMGITSYR